MCRAVFVGFSVFVFGLVFGLLSFWGEEVFVVFVAIVVILLVLSCCVGSFFLPLFFLGGGSVCRCVHCLFVVLLFVAVVFYSFVCYVLFVLYFSHIECIGRICVLVSGCIVWV